MGQVWSSANFDGTNGAGYLGGRGSLLAVTAQNQGPDGLWGTADDLLTPLNQRPVDTSIDQNIGPSDHDLNDRVRGFDSQHVGGSFFAFGDGSVHFVTEEIDPAIYRQTSTRNGREVISSP